MTCGSLTSLWRGRSRPSRSDVLGVALRAAPGDRRLSDAVPGVGAVLAQGTAEEVKSNEEVIEAYLGTGLKNQPDAHIP